MLMLSLFKFALVILAVFCIWFMVSRLVFRVLGIKDESFTITTCNSTKAVRLNAEIVETILLVNGG